MKEAEHERPDRSHSEPREIEERGSLMIVIHPCVFDDTTVRAWLTRTHASAPGSAVVTIEVEDLEMRARRSLTAGLTRAFISTLVELRKMRRIGERSPVVDGHRSWCSRLENEGEPHRSQELEAAEEHNGDVIRVWLAQGADQQGKSAAKAYVEMRTDGVVLQWPPLTLLQHYALPRRLNYLLDELRLMDSEARALPRFM